jgi:excisionase family DNA binding protein
MPDDDILNVQQVAAQFSVTPQTVRSWIDSGKLKAGRVGKAYRILRRDVYAMLEHAATERQTPDHDMWEDRAAQLQPTRQTSEPAEIWPTAATKRALLPRRPA